jgi:acetate kinase
MATRPGSVDPGALLYLLRHRVSVEELDTLLEHESGLLGLSGISEDVEQLLSSRDPAAAFALRVFAYRVATAVAAMTVALDGLDALVFTAGIGENAASVRGAVCERLEFLAPFDVVVVNAREDVIAARAARAVLGG